MVFFIDYKLIIKMCKGQHICTMPDIKEAYNKNGNISNNKTEIL